MGNSHSKLDLNADTYWLRENDNKGWKKYDSETSQKIETTLDDAMDKKIKGLIYITLNEGPFFGQGKYECNFIVDFSNPNKPIIHNAFQKNVITGYKRNIKRQIKSKLSEPDEKSSEVIADVNLKESMTKQQQKMNEDEKKESTMVDNSMLFNSLENDQKQRNGIKNLQQQLADCNQKMINVKHLQKQLDVDNYKPKEEITAMQSKLEVEVQRTNEEQLNMTINELQKQIKDIRMRSEQEKQQTISHYKTMLSNSLENNAKQRNEIKNLQQLLKNSNNKMISIKNTFDAESKILKKNLHTAQGDRNMFEKQMNEVISKQQQQANTIENLEKKLNNNNYKHKREKNGLKREIQHFIRTASDWEYKYNELLKTKNNSLLKRNKTQADVVLYKLKKEIQFHIRNASNFEQQMKELRNRLIESTCTVDLSTELPVIEDVIYKYDMIKTQLHTQAAKSIRRKLKQQNVYSQMKISKMANHLLFDILIDFYNKIKMNKSIVDVNDVCEIIVNGCLKKHMFLKDDDTEMKKHILLYARKCMLVCLDMQMLRNPTVVIDPVTFEPSNKQDIMYNNKYIAAFGSEKTDHLNYVMWPGIVRDDTKHIVEKPIAVFKNEITK